MNVLGIVSFRIFPTWMGGQKGVALFYKHLQQHASVVLAASTDNQSSEIKIERLLYPNKKIYLNLFRLKKLKRLVSENNIDLILAEHSYTAWLALFLRRSTGKPFVIHSHNIESKRFHQMKKWWWKLYRSYEGWIHRKADHNFFISEEDRVFALKCFGLAPSKTSVVTYGVSEPGLYQKKELRRELGLAEEGLIFLFNGTLDYKPNYDAVEILIKEIEPLLRKQLNRYQILITGNRAPKNLVAKILSASNILYVGYVDDVNQYYQAADLFINPVANDTGIKTKLVEAIANHCTAISTESGASGIRKDLCIDKLVTVSDGNWNEFAKKIKEYCNGPSSPAPPIFFDYYSWNNIASKASEKLSEVIHEV